jgi:hypothetical protein
LTGPTAKACAPLECQRLTAHVDPGQGFGWAHVAAYTARASCSMTKLELGG